MKVTLIHPKMHIKAYHFFPLGVGFIASALEVNNIEYCFYDMHREWLSIRGLVKRIKNDGLPEIFAISALITSYSIVSVICKELKKRFPDVPIVIGGKITVLNQKQLFDHINVDYIIRGEGEISFIQLIDFLSKKIPINQVSGLSYRNEENVIMTNNEVKLLTDISNYYIPYKSIDLSGYVSKRTVQSPNLLSMNIVSSRGCPFRCSFCNFSKGNHNHMRYYDIDLIAEFLDYMKLQYGLQHITFNDDIFTVNKKRVIQLCNCLKERNLGFSCSTRLDCLDEELISILEESGCRYICLGIESPSPAVAKIIDKRLDLSKYQKNIERLKKSNIIVNFGFIIGYLGETESTISETREFVIKNQIIYTAFFATAFPQTLLYDMIKHRIDDEHAYLTQLGKVDLSADYLINMTDIPIKKLYRLRDELVADSVLNAIRFRIIAKPIIKKIFVMYLMFMRHIGLKIGFLKKIFEFINIVFVKPSVT